MRAFQKGITPLSEKFMWVGGGLLEYSVTPVQSELGVLSLDSEF